MDTTEIIQKVRQILISVLKHERFEIRNDLSASDVDGWDSLTHMEIITRIEKEFNCRFKLKELNRLNTVGSLIELIKSKL